MTSDANIIDLSEPTGWWEVSVWHHAGGTYEVSTDRGLGRLAVWNTGNRDKALGVAEYLDREGRQSAAGDRLITNAGAAFDGSIVHWDCGCTQAEIDASRAGRGLAADEAEDGSEGAGR